MDREATTCLALTGPSSCFLGLNHPLITKWTGGPMNEVGILVNTTDTRRQLPSWHQPNITVSQSRWSAMVSPGSRNSHSFNTKREAICQKGGEGSDTNTMTISVASQHWHTDAGWELDAESVTVSPCAEQRLWEGISHL